MQGIPVVHKNDYVLTNSGAFDLSTSSPDLKYFSREDLKEEVSQFLFPEKSKQRVNLLKEVDKIWRTTIVILKSLLIQKGHS